MQLSVVLITLNEEQNLARTLESVQPLVVDGKGEIVVVDSGSTDRTVEIAKSFGAKVFVEEWKGFAAQKNSAIEKAAGEWVLSLDADEEVDKDLAADVVSFPIRRGSKPPRPTAQWAALLGSVVLAVFIKPKGVVGVRFMPNLVDGYYIARKNFFLGRWIRHGGFWPDRKLRLFRRDKGRFLERPVHETVRVDGPTAFLQGPLFRGALLHHAYPTLENYLEHMRRYADLGAEMIMDKPRWWLWLNRWLNPPLTFLYNYVVRLGFLDGREGFLLHWNHARYVGWKYEKALELARVSSPRSRGGAENG
ncbi:MAG: glycosyltransferase family 2 protein [Acidobacteriota bacterium]|nr:glycosyltransferase family 2 protein [Acidobacteriota bacterium]